MLIKPSKRGLFFLWCNVMNKYNWQPIETAPEDGTVVWVYLAAYDGLPAFACECAFSEIAGWCADELRTVTHWKPANSQPVSE